MTEAIVLPPPEGALDPEAELDRLAVRYRAAGGAGLKLLNALGTGAEGLLDRLPAPVRTGLDGATEQALYLSLRAAEQSRRVTGDPAPWVNTAMTSVFGAAGGFAGLSGALVELPATTTLLMRAIQGAAARQGFDPAAESVRFDCVRVFAAAGPLADDDGSDLSFLSLRLTLTGPALQRLITAVAPRLSVALGQKLAAQAVPVLGAVAGAGVNYAYTRYYQQVAEVHFGLRRLAIEADVPHADLVARFAARIVPRG